MHGSYARFAAMIALSVAAMYAMTYLNIYTPDHAFYSQSRLYMVFYMGAVMAVIMLVFMWDMYPNATANVAILVGAALVFAISLWMLRAQIGVGEVRWMQAMIPHHSIAVLTSERATITDARVRRLADDIIATQNREIAEMKALIADLQGRRKLSASQP